MTTKTQPTSLVHWQPASEPPSMPFDVLLQVEHSGKPFVIVGYYHAPTQRWIDQRGDGVIGRAVRWAFIPNPQEDLT